MKIKNLITVSFLFLINSIQFTVFAQLTSKVDERFELTSIAFRLAEANEYTNNELESYTGSIDDYFSKYKTHPLIKYIKETLREQHYIGYDAVSGSTCLLEIANGKVRLSPQADIDNYVKHETRWTKDALVHYVDLLNSFYRDSKFRTFYNQHKDLYAKAENRLNILLETINTEWFESFYGKPLGSPYVYIGMCNGGSNYAFDTLLKDKPSEYGIVIGCWEVDEDNIPVFKEYEVIPVIIHEYSHHFANPLVEKNEVELKTAGDIIYPYVEEQLKAVGYSGSRTMCIEGFNSLFTNMYFKENSIPFDAYHVSKDMGKGYIWMRRAVSFMDNFYADRNSYPTIEDFFPQLIKFMDFTADNISLVKQEYENETPYVVNVYPAQNSIVDSHSIDTIKIEFSQPMFAYATRPDDKHQFEKFDYEKTAQSVDGKTLLIPITLKEDTSYSIAISGQSMGRFETKEKFILKFKTK